MGCIETGHPPTYFDNRYEDEWITNPLTVEMIKDVDKSEVINAHLIDSPVLGTISVKEISGGGKKLILMAFDTSGKIFNASSCGDNCAKWILQISRRIKMIFQEDNSYNDIREKSLKAWLDEMAVHEDIAVRGGVKLAREYIMHLENEIDKLKESNELKTQYLKKMKEQR